jgi:hypothetical protein
MPRKNGNTTVPEQNSYLSHLSGMQVTRKTGESKFDPSTQLNRGKLEVSSARGSDLDTVLLAATSQRSDITELARSYQRKVGINCSSQLAVLERRRAAYQAGKHYHRPHLIDSHNSDAKSHLLEGEGGFGYENTMRSVLYDVQLPVDRTVDQIALAVSNRFKNEMLSASESDDPLQNLVVATQMARYEEALRKQYREDDEDEVEWIEEDGCIFVKDPDSDKPKEDERYGCKIPITDWNIDVERNEDGEITKVTERHVSNPEQNEKGVEEAQEKIEGCGGIQVEGDDGLPTSGENNSGGEDTEWDKEQVEQSIAEALDAYGTTQATGASKTETKGFKDESDSEYQETTQEKLDRIRAEMAIKAEEQRQINPENLYGVHQNDVIKLDRDELEPLLRTTPVNLLLNETRDVKGQSFTRVGNPSSRTWRTRLGDLAVFKRPPDTLGNVVVMTDMSGSMGCGCQRCFSYKKAENAICSDIYRHEHQAPKYPIKDQFRWMYLGNQGVERSSHISNGDGTATCIQPTPGAYTGSHWSNGALAREVVTAISNRFKHQTKTFGFTSGGWHSGTKIAEFPSGTFPNHKGFENFGGGTPTCSAMDYMNELLAGSLSRTAGVFIADGQPGAGGMMKELPIRNCDGGHYRHLAESFAKRGMRFGVVSVGYSQFPADIPNATSVHIKSTDDIAKLAPLFTHLGGR